ncbi:MAG: NfeD family protein [Myxococcales bacterium]|nr:NfeD family protein [Myxococcales bacterium]MCB9707984.1 NfeD family protein [Myxococcales bacterium]
MSSEWLLMVGILATGFLLLAVEVFLIPGFGIAGPMGALTIIGGIAFAWAKLGALWGMASLGASMVLSGVALWLFPRSPAGKRLVLRTGLSGARAVDDGLDALLGAHGVTITPLRPSGVVEFGQQRIDVVTDGSYLEPHSPVRVVRIEGNRIVVEPLVPESLHH